MASAVPWLDQYKATESAQQDDGVWLPVKSTAAEPRGAPRDGHSRRGGDALGDGSSRTACSPPDTPGRRLLGAGRSLHSRSPPAPGTITA
ncbi:hypothetical protein PLESTF_001010700 [Pleodorina starrii]|nr:hypothetical protein PLESTF_001010700 [Pleodorina starrii]